MAQVQVGLSKIAIQVQHRAQRSLFLVLQTEARQTGK
jgi:hypothetical protein